MAFTTYENHHNPHVTIHKDDCNQIRKHGGEHKYGGAQYQHHATYQLAQVYARGTKLPVRDCAFCKPI
jgi:hypothetical protein